MRINRHALALALGTVILAGCRDDGTPVNAPRAPEAPPAAASAKEVSRVARGLALALRKEPVRLAVRDAMRASRVTEHKLVLHEFLASDAGSLVAAEAAGALGQSPQALEAAVKALPALDFYLPSREHRMTWRGEEGVAVGVRLEKAPGTVPGFDTHGAPVAFPAGERADRVLFILQPAESKGRRIGAQPDGPGEVIQDPDDGEVSMSVVDEDAAGKRTVIDLADLPYRDGKVTLPGGAEIRVAPVAGKRGQAPALQAPDAPRLNTAGPADTTRLDYIIIYFEDNLTDETSEIELRATYHNKTGGIAGTRTLRMEGVRDCWDMYATCYYYTPRLPLIFNRIRDQTAERISVHLFETDSWPNGDDDKGWANLVWDDNGRVECFLRGGACDAEAIFGWTPVAPIVGRVEFTPGPIILQHPATTTLTARVTDVDGRVIDVPVSWRVHDPTVATVTPTGNLTATLTTHRVGYSYVYAKAQNYETWHPVNALGPVAQVDISPYTLSSFIGTSYQIVARGYDANGNGPVPGRPVTWSIDDPSVATISSTGVLSYVGTGTTTVRATIDGVQGTRSVTSRVRPVQWIYVSPNSATATTGGTVHFTAEVYGEGSVRLYDRPVTWTVSNPSVATIVSTGTTSVNVQAVAGGTVTVTATLEGVQGSATLTVDGGIVEPCLTLKSCPKTPFEEPLESRASSASATPVAAPRRQ